MLDLNIVLILSLLFIFVGRSGTLKLFLLVGSVYSYSFEVGSNKKEKRVGKGQNSLFFFFFVYRISGDHMNFVDQIALFQAY